MVFLFTDGAYGIKLFGFCKGFYLYFFFIIYNFILYLLYSFIVFKYTRSLKVIIMLHPRSFRYYLLFHPNKEAAVPQITLTTLLTTPQNQTWQQQLVVIVRKLTTIVLVLTVTIIAVLPETILRFSVWMMRKVYCKHLIMILINSELLS